MKRYKVYRVYKTSYRKKLIEKGLTRPEAQRLVQKDIEINPDAKRSMLVFSSY